jgi:hypothetical protein
MFVPGARLSNAAPLNEVVNEKLGTRSLALPSVNVKIVADEAVGSRASSGLSNAAKTVSFFI